MYVPKGWAANLPAGYAVTYLADGMEATVREFDVVVWGASGFTGRLVAEFLHGRYGPDDLSWAMAGRNLAKLERVRAEIGAEGIPIVIADANQADTLEALVARTTVLCSTAGPYAIYGSALVAACVAAGTHYCDLTGEVAWMRRMIDAHHEMARTTGARIVHSCGFDSVPSDLGVWLLQREMVERFGVPASAIKFRLRKASGGFSGGTAASMLNMLDEADADPQLQQLLANPYALDPQGAAGGLDGLDSGAPHQDAHDGTWVAPFVMGAINTRVVRRSNALMGYPYGHDFRYEEGMAFGPGARGFVLALLMSLGFGAFNAVARVRTLRDLLARLLPKAGEGPSAAAREAGFFAIELYARHGDDVGKSLRLLIRGDRDPGYGATAKMLGESAVCLAKDPLAVGGGVLTPAVAMAGELLERLLASAGMSFELADG